MLDKYPPGVTGYTTVTYYDIQGRTLRELSAEMRRLGPKIDGASYVGETRSPMRWSWRVESRAGACTIRNLVVAMNAQILLPRWTPPADAEPGLVAEWNRFIAALETHEAGHKDISARAGAAIADQLRGLSAPCAMINDRANDIARVIADRASEEQKRYDAETRHGIRQGTTFGHPDAIDVSPCFVHIDTPLGAGAAQPTRSYLRLRNRPPAFLVEGKAAEFYRDSALTQSARQDGVWEAVGRDTLRLDYWVVPTTIATLRRQDAGRWTGEITYGGDAVFNGRPATFRSRIDLIPYRCPFPPNER